MFVEESMKGVRNELSAAISRADQRMALSSTPADEGGSGICPSRENANPKAQKPRKAVSGFT